MKECKKYQAMIRDFDKGKLSCNDREEFVKHLERCEDCREEFEIYYIIEYGLNDGLPNVSSDSEYWDLLDKYDFKGLIDRKIKDCHEQIEMMKKHSDFMNMCCIIGNVFILLAFIEYVIIRYF